MKEFIEYILRFGNLNEQQIDFISGKAEIVELKKNEYIAEAGKTVKRIAFILEGIVRICYYDNKGGEITKYFFDNSHLLYSPEFMTGMPMPEYWQTVTDCQLVVFSIREWKELSDTIIGWDEIIQKIVTKNHREKLDKRSLMVAQDATTRYLDFFTQFPTLVNQIPLSYIASYLGITQSSLSRIRKNIR